MPIITGEGYSSAKDIVVDVINAAWDQGIIKQTEYAAKIEAATNETTGFLGTVNTPTVTAGTVSLPTIDEPAVDIPSTQSATDIMTMFDSKYSEIITDLASRFSTFKTSYFPDDSAALADVITRMDELAAVTIPTASVTTVTAPTISDTVGVTTINGSTVTMPAVTETVTPTTTSGTSVAVQEVTDSVSATTASGSTVSLPAMTDTVAGTTLTAGSVGAPTVSEPVVTIPSAVDTSAILTIFDQIYTELVALLETKFQDYRTTYFATEGTVYDSAEDWLIASIANANVAIPAPIAAQIWGDDQTRILADKVRAQDAVVAQFAARRFPLPPDVAASAVLQIEQKAQDELAESSRKVALTSVDLMQKTIERALQLRVTAMQSANDYIKGLASGPDVASRLVGIGYDAQSKLISSVASLLNARTEVAKLALQADTTSANLALEAGKLNQAIALDVDKANLGASLDMAKLDVQARTVTAQLALEAAKANQAISLDADKANLGAVIDLAKLDVQAKTTTAQLALEAAKANQAADLDADKAKLAAAVDLARLAVQAETSTAQLALDALKANQGVALDADKANLGASIENAKMSLQAATTNVQIAFEAAKANQMAALEQVKLAISSTIDLRVKSMDSAVRYISALASAPDISSKLVGVGYDAQSKLIASAAAFYNARTQAKETVAKVSQFNTTTALEAAVKNQQAEMGIIEDKLKALLAEAQALAQMSTSLFNNIHTQASVGANRNTSVGYQYQNDTASTATTVTDVW